MKLRCTIGSQGFVGGDTYRYGDVYELDNDETAKRLIKQGYAEEVAVIASPVPIPPLLKANKEDIPKSDKTIKAKRKS